MPNQLFVIYHGGCTDGLASCLAVKAAHEWYSTLLKKREDDVIFWAGAYDKPPPDASEYNNRHVYLVDFSYPANVLRKIAKEAASVTILDHHKTAQKDLAEFIAGSTAMGWSPEKFAVQAFGDGEVNIRAKFDMTKSGAVLTWEHFHPELPVPLFFQYIQDRDLWRKELPDNELFTWGLRSHPLTLAAWWDLCDGYLRGPESMQQNLIDQLCGEGESVAHFFALQVEEQKVNAHPIIIERDGVHHHGVACNAPYFMASDLAGKMSYDSPEGWAICYFTQRDGWKFSLRSRDDFDVGALAHGYSCTGRGGGHTNAAGFEITDLSRVHWDRDDQDRVVLHLTPRAQE